MNAREIGPQNQHLIARYGSQPDTQQIEATLTEKRALFGPCVVIDETRIVGPTKVGMFYILLARVRRA